MTYNANLTTSGAIAATAAKQFYDRRLLENMKPLLVHNQFAQKRPMPAHNGKTVEFRRWTPFGPLTQPLSEGEPPEGQTLDMSSLTVTVRQYGGFVTISDLLDLTAIDNVKNDAVGHDGPPGRAHPGHPRPRRAAHGRQRDLRRRQDRPRRAHRRGQADQPGAAQGRGAP